MRKISQKPLIVSNIVMEPKNKSTKFLLFGSFGKGVDLQDKTVVISLDFSSVHVRSCKGIDAPTTPESDYTFFQPLRDYNDPCIKGHEEVFVRRKGSAKCLVDESEGFLVHKKNCKCKESDWICDRDY